MKESKEISEGPGYWISRNDFILLDGGDDEDGEELICMEKELFDEMLSEKKLNENKYTIKINTKNPGNPIVEVVEREKGEKKEKGVVTFDDADLDEGLLNKRSVEVLKNLKLPLPSKLKK